MTTTIKFTADVEGNSPDEMEERARVAANEFFKELPKVPVFTGASVSYDPEYYAHRVQNAIDEAEARVEAYRAAHKDEEDFADLEAVPAEVKKFSGSFEFEYEIETTQPKKSITEVYADHNAATAAQPEYSGPPENNPIYQDAFQ